MTMGKRNHAAALEIRLLREGIVESVHETHAVVCDERGRLLSVAGSAETACFIRSSLKPFQALVVATSGVMERYSLSDRDLAVMCSSHKGTMEQVRQVFNILWHCDVDLPMLQCPIPEGGNSPLSSTVLANMLGCWQSANFSIGPYKPICSLNIPCNR
jgi:L-asparaginase